MTFKVEAQRFFARLEAHLNSGIPTPETTRVEIAAAVEKARSAARRTTERHSTFAEGAFLNTYVIRQVHGFLLSELGFTSEDARRALLSESYRGYPELASASPVRPGSHPFRKIVAVSPRQIINIWRGGAGVNPLARNSCPDLALRSPAPYRTVFEAKYHTSPRVRSAEAELVRSIYQAFFYLALPRLPETSAHAAWDYEFACVLVYDATLWRTCVSSVAVLAGPGENRLLVRRNVYVMVLRGSHAARAA